MLRLSGHLSGYTSNAAYGCVCVCARVCVCVCVCACVCVPVNSYMKEAGCL